MGIDHHRSEPGEGCVAPVGVDLSEEVQRIVGLTAVGAMEVWESMAFRGIFQCFWPAI